MGLVQLSGPIFPTESCIAHTADVSAPVGFTDIRSFLFIRIIYPKCPPGKLVVVYS